MVTYKLNLDITKPRLKTGQMEFVSGDVGAYRLEVRLTNGGVPMPIDGFTFTVSARREDGTVVSDAGVIRENTAFYTLHSSMYSQPGTVVLHLKFSDALGNLVTAKILRVPVLAGCGDGEEVSEQVNVYTALLGQLTERLSLAETLLSESVFSYDAEREEIQKVLSAILELDKSLLGGEGE